MIGVDVDAVDLVGGVVQAARLAELADAQVADGIPAHPSK